jgi:hypothetical protein
VGRQRCCGGVVRLGQRHDAFRDLRGPAAAAGW